MFARKTKYYCKLWSAQGSAHWGPLKWRLANASALAHQYEGFIIYQRIICVHATLCLSLIQLSCICTYNIRTLRVFVSSHRERRRCLSGISQATQISVCQHAPYQGWPESTAAVTKSPHECAERTCVCSNILNGWRSHPPRNPKNDPADAAGPFCRPTSSKTANFCKNNPDFSHAHVFEACRDFVIVRN